MAPLHQQALGAAGPEDTDGATGEAEHLGQAVDGDAAAFGDAEDGGVPAGAEHSGGTVRSGRGMAEALRETG